MAEWSGYLTGTTRKSSDDPAREEVTDSDTNLHYIPDTERYLIQHKSWLYILTENKLLFVNSQVRLQCKDSTRLKMLKAQYWFIAGSLSTEVAR